MTTPFGEGWIDPSVEEEVMQTLLDRQRREAALSTQPRTEHRMRANGGGLLGLVGSAGPERHHDPIDHDDSYSDKSDRYQRWVR